VPTPVNYTQATGIDGDEPAGAADLLDLLASGHPA